MTIWHSLLSVFKLRASVNILIPSPWLLPHTCHSLHLYQFWSTLPPGIPLNSGTPCVAHLRSYPFNFQGYLSAIIVPTCPQIQRTLQLVSHMLSKAPQAPHPTPTKPTFFPESTSSELKSLSYLLPFQLSFTQVITHSHLLVLNERLPYIRTPLDGSTNQRGRSRE